jgi:YVTN family beta-propeller protein
MEGIMFEHRTVCMVACAALRVAALGALMGLVAVITPDDAASSAERGVVYTANEQGRSVSAIDLATGRTTTVEIQIAPHNVQASADGRLLLATGSLAPASHRHASNHERGRLVVLDTGAFGAGPILDIEVGRHPAHVVLDAAGRVAFVTNAEDATVSVVDLARREVVTAIPTAAYPHGLRLSPDGRELYVANVKDGSVSVIATAALAEVARIPVGEAPVQVGFTPDGGQAFVSLRDEDLVAVIDTAARRVVDKIAVGRGPIQVYATPDGRELYVANEGTRESPDRRVSVIDIAEGGVVATVVTGTGPHGVVVSPDGRRTFVTNLHDATVSAIDTATREVVVTYAVGAGPNGITYGPRLR